MEEENRAGQNGKSEVGRHVEKPNMLLLFLIKKQLGFTSFTT